MWNKKISILGLWRFKNKKIFFQMNMRLASVVLQMEMVQVRWPPFSLENEKCSWWPYATTSKRWKIASIYYYSKKVCISPSNLIVEETCCFLCKNLIFLQNNLRRLGLKPARNRRWVGSYKAICLIGNAANSGSGSKRRVSNPDSVRSVDPDPCSEFRIQEGNNDPQKQKKLRNFMFFF